MRGEIEATRLDVEFLFRAFLTTLTVHPVGAEDDTSCLGKDHEAVGHRFPFSLLVDLPGLVKHLCTDAGPLALPDATHDLIAYVIVHGAGGLRPLLMTCFNQELLPDQVVLGGQGYRRRGHFHT